MHRQHPVSRVPQFGLGGGERVVVDVGECHGGACFGERAGGGQAHAGAGSRDEGDLAGEVVGGVHRVAVSLLRFVSRGW